MVRGGRHDGWRLLSALRQLLSNHPPDMEPVQLTARFVPHSKLASSSHSASTLLFPRLQSKNWYWEVQFISSKKLKLEQPQTSNCIPCNNSIWGQQLTRDHWSNIMHFNDWHSLQDWFVVRVTEVITKVLSAGPGMTLVRSTMPAVSVLSLYW